jgi:hypothetical protein
MYLLGFTRAERLSTIRKALETLRLVRHILDRSHCRCYWMDDISMAIWSHIPRAHSSEDLQLPKMLVFILDIVHVQSSDVASLVHPVLIVPHISSFPPPPLSTHAVSRYKNVSQTPVWFVSTSDETYLLATRNSAE